MAQVKNLSGLQCILLASSFASSALLDSLNVLISSRLDVFDQELLYRILLTFLPETLEPSVYVDLVANFSTGNYPERNDIEVDISPVKELSDAQARKLVKKLHLLQLRHPSIPQDVEVDDLASFLIHRVHKVEAETGLLAQAPQLVGPFLSQSEYLRQWFLSSILPLLRLNYDYYPQNDSPMLLDTFERLYGAVGVKTLLSGAEDSEQRGTASADTVGRDFRGILSPWVNGSSQRKRRKLNFASPLETETQVAKLRITTSPENAESEDELTDWQHTFNWITTTAVENFPLVVKAVEGWDGPSDVDLGEYGPADPDWDGIEGSKEELTIQYCQAAFAAIYAAEQDTPETVEGAHNILVRLAILLDFEPPPDLATSVDMLPRIERQSKDLHDTPMALLQVDTLLNIGHPLTTPKTETFSLLQMFVYSSYLLASLGYRLSVAKVAKLRFWSDEHEQLIVLQRIIHGLLSGPRRDEDQWAHIRDVIRWLRDWDLESSFAAAKINSQSDGGSETDPSGNVVAHNDYGVFAKVDRRVLEKEILGAYCTAGQFDLIAKTYLSSAVTPLSRDEVHNTIIDLALQYYDNASNGSRKRGGVKKASDIIAAFREQFPQSQAFRRLEALFAATHALSFYSLTLQHGVPFTPVGIRVNDDPVSLVQKVLEQNQNSYTQLDNLVTIARNLTISMEIQPSRDEHADDESSRVRNSEQRVTNMAIEAALAEDDFETAYSYVVNRLNPPPPTSAANTDYFPDDDISWRAAYHAGRYRSPTSSSQPHLLRRLEQRMELLSQSLLLAPSPHLTEIIAAWRRCEEELLALLAHEDAADEAADNRADGKITRAGGAVPGGFGEEAAEQAPSRRKDAWRGGGESEAPMGLFDVARGAAAAFGRSRGGGGGRMGQVRAVAGTLDESGKRQSGERVRKRDVVANAVTGGLASGIGWVLGATPVRDSGEE